MYRAFVILLIFCCTSRLIAQTGCTDPNALNYDPAATINDGSCLYPMTTYSLTLKTELTDTLMETSGIIGRKNWGWTHNDSGGEPAIYKFDASTGKIKQIVYIDKAHSDWEDIAEDSTYIFIGEFGNNNGTRKDLKVYRIKKADISTTKFIDTVSAETIEFSYPDQTDFTSSSTHNFDCEAMLAFGDSLYLFSKNRGDFKTKLYALPKTPGTYSAYLKDSFDVDGQITGADIATNGEVALIGYDLRPTLGASFIWLIWDYSGSDFFSGNKRRIDLGNSLANGQTEGIMYYDDYKGYVSAEKTSLTPVKLSEYETHTWTRDTMTGLFEHTGTMTFGFGILPNPAAKQVLLNFYGVPAVKKLEVEMYDSIGQLVYRKRHSVSDIMHKIDVTKFAPGQYYVHVAAGGAELVKPLIIYPDH